jgi:hypothetical protein
MKKRVQHKGERSSWERKPDLRENRILQGKKVEALCMEKEKVDLDGTTIERLVVLVFCSRPGRSIQGEGRTRQFIDEATHTRF